MFILYLDTEVTELVINKHTYDSVPWREVKILNLSLCQVTTIETWGSDTAPHFLTSVPHTGNSLASFFDHLTSATCQVEWWVCSEGSQNAVTKGSILSHA